ncbi:hypothetical protein KC342_g63 [Hortaea werneckii]|nr:hypothetical protein KC342_g63 [Hortaea werneckii]
MDVKQVNDERYRRRNHWANTNNLTQPRIAAHTKLNVMRENALFEMPSRVRIPSRPPNRVTSQTPCLFDELHLLSRRVARGNVICVNTNARGDALCGFFSVAANNVAAYVLALNHAKSSHACLNDVAYTRLSTNCLRDWMIIPAHKVVCKSERRLLCNLARLRTAHSCYDEICLGQCACLVKYDIGRLVTSFDGICLFYDYTSPSSHSSGNHQHHRHS